MFTTYTSLDELALVILLVTLLGFIIGILPIFLVFHDIYNEKISPYECGFNPFEEVRTPFDIHFYLVAILFLIFDLEISLLFPWVVIFCELTLLGSWVMLWFLLILSFGFVFEWTSGALDWS